MTNLTLPLTETSRLVIREQELIMASASGGRFAGAESISGRSDNKMAAEGIQRMKSLSSSRYDPKGYSDSSGWGKQAAQRLSNKDQFKNDPLLKTLEGKIAVNYGDYKPWQRTTSPRYGVKAKPGQGPAPSKRVRGRPASSRMSNSAASFRGFRRDDTVLVGPRPFSAATVQTACSSICAHPWIVKKPPPVDDAEERRKQSTISIMKVCYFSRLINHCCGYTTHADVY